MGFYLLTEVSLVLDNARDEQRQSALAGHLDRQMDALVWVNAAQENQMVPCGFLKRVKREVDSAIDRRDVIQSGRAVGVADRNEVSIAILLIDGHDLGGRESMDRRENRCLDQARVR